MGYTYCTKLSVDSSVDSAGTNDASYFNPPYGFPFAGFVNFTERGETPNPFESSQDYLQRWDSANEIIDQDNTNTTICSEANGTCVKINGMYCSTSSNIFHLANLNMFKESNKVFLSMVPLAKNINSDERGLSFFMDMGSEIKTEQTITLPYSTNSTVDGCYIDFCAAGFCKSNVPYIGLEYISRMINLDLDVDSSTNYYSLYSSNALDDIFGKTEKRSLISSQNTTEWVDTYEWPGQGCLLLSPYLLLNTNIGVDLPVISDTYDDTSNNCFTWKLCNSIRAAIKELAGARTEGNIVRVGVSDYEITFDEKFEGDSYKISSYCLLLSNAGVIYFKDSSGNFNQCDKNFFNFKVIFRYGSYSHLGDNTIGYSNTCSLYNNSLLSYYLDKGEKFKKGYNSYCDASEIDNGRYLFVIRSITDTLLPTYSDFGYANLYDSSMTKSFLQNCNLSTPESRYYNRMDLYPNTSGGMTIFKVLDKKSYDSKDSSIFKPITSQTGANAYINYIPAFYKTPSWNTPSYTPSSKLSNMGVIEDSVKIKFNGALYVSEVTLVFKEDTISSLSESSNIIVGNNKKSVRSGLVNSQGNIEFTFTFNESDTPAKISSSSGKATKNNMNVYAVGAHQMLKYCSFPGYAASENTSFDSIYRLDANNINSADSQMTFTKITGRIPVRLSGTGLYDNGSTNVKLISAYIKLTDTSSLDVCVYSLGIVEGSGYPYSSGLLGWLGTNQNIKFISPKKVELPYTIYQPFLGSMSGDIPRYSSYDYDTSLHNMGISSFTSEHDKYKSKIGLDSSNNVICVGPNYKDSSANSGTFGTLKTFSDPNSAYTIDLEFKQLTYDLGLQNSNGTTSASGIRGTSVGAKSVYYSISENPFASGPNLTSINSQLNNGSTYIDFLLPEPHLNAVLVYDSVEFNRASAWTFMRSMPLQPGSADAPHILIYKVEAWVTEEGTTKVDEKSTMTMHFDYKVSSIFSGYVSSEDSKNNIFDDYNLCVKGINDAIYEPDILNNCYLKVDDNGNTEELNAVGTAFPIIDITGNDASYYGAPGLTAKIYSNIESFEDSSDNINDNEIYDKLFLKAKTILNPDSSTSEGAQVVVLSYCHPDLKPSSTGSGDKRKVIYICVGFYNNREEMIPINGKFGITYTVTPDGGDPTTYTKYMYLSEFFPKDSMIYLAGNDYKNNTEKEENNKFAFVTPSISETYSKLIGDGVNSNDASISTDNSEIINIGPGDGMSYEIASSSTSKSEDGKDGYWGHPGHYGILNRYTGKVSFVSDVPYENYTEYTNSLEGKCLLNYEHICYFPNKTGVVELL